MASQPTLVTSSLPDEQAAVKQKSRPTKTLPTDRITFQKQLELLRAWAAASSPPGTPVSNSAVADMMKMNASTISLANPFLASIGLLQKVEGGYLPSSDVIAFHRAAEYSDTPGHKLAACMRAAWFGTALLPKLSFKPLPESEVLALLHDAATAPLDYRNQIKMLVDYLIAAGVAQREGDMIKAAKPSFEYGVGAETESESTKQSPSQETFSPPKQNISTAFAASPEGGISFHISVRVNMDQFSTWKPERITAFFNGIATMLAAKANVESGDK